MSKKLLALPIVVLVAVALLGCTGTPDTPSSTSGQNTAVPMQTGASGTAQTGTPGTLQTAAPAPDKGVTYTVESDSPTAISISYSTLETGSYSVKEADTVALPWSLTLDGVSPDQFGGDGLTLIAQSTGAGTMIRCRISYDGTTITEKTVDGAYGVAICSSLQP